MPQTYDEFIQSMVPGAAMTWSNREGEEPTKATIGSGYNIETYPIEEAKRVFEDLRSKREEALKEAYRTQTQAFIDKQMVDSWAAMTESQVAEQSKRLAAQKLMSDMATQRRFQSTLQANAASGMDPREAYADAAYRAGFDPSKMGGMQRDAVAGDEVGTGEPTVSDVAGTGMKVVRAPGSKAWRLIQTEKKAGDLTAQEKGAVAAFKAREQSLTRTLEKLIPAAGLMGPDSPAAVKVGELKAERQKLIEKQDALLGVTGGPAGDGGGEVPPPEVTGRLFKNRKGQTIRYVGSGDPMSDKNKANFQLVE
jgi:hypothetical protein